MVRQIHRHSLVLHRGPLYELIKKMLALSGLAMSSEGFFISPIALWYSPVTILAERKAEDKVPTSHSLA